MAKKKTDWEGIKFDEMFGDCQSNDRNLTDEPYMKLVYLDDRTVKPCKECGRYPRLHVANFINRATHPNNIYVSCECGACTGEWYPDRMTAINAWNEDNKDAVPRKDGEKDIHDTVRTLMENVRIPD